MPLRTIRLILKLLIVAEAVGSVLKSRLAPCPAELQPILLTDRPLPRPAASAGLNQSLAHGQACCGAGFRYHFAKPLDIVDLHAGRAYFRRSRPGPYGPRKRLKSGAQGARRGRACKCSPTRKACARPNGNSRNCALRGAPSRGRGRRSLPGTIAEILEG